MSKKTILYTGIISLFLTCFTPFIFDIYLQDKPINTIVSFGAPFPFISESITIPHGAKFPLKIDFHFNGWQNTTFHMISFFLSFIAIFLLVLSLTAIFLRFFKKEHKI